jgi:IS30 family transposase
MSILTYRDRVVIATLLNEGKNKSYIAEILDVYPSRITYELKRCPDGEYDADIAEANASRNLSKRGRKIVLTDKVNNFISTRVKEYHWSFETIAHILNISFKTIYNWFDNGLLNLTPSDLPEKGIRKRKKAETRGTYTRSSKTIEQRPVEANERQTIGHFEIDTVLSGKAKAQALAVFVDRKSRFTIIRRLKSKDSNEMHQKLTEICKSLGPNIKSVTSDHGKEFARFKQIEKDNEIDFYFAHAYSPHERGTNERINRDIRSFIPKGIKIETITDEELSDIACKLNARPRKCLDWKTPFQIFYSEYENNF